MSKRRGHHNVGWPAPPARRRGRPRRRGGAEAAAPSTWIPLCPPYFAPRDVIRAAGCCPRLEPCARAE